MVKRIISVVVALAAAMAVIMGGEKMGGILFKTPAMDPHNPQTISDMMANMPVAAFLWLLIGYAFSSFLGGMVATFISGRKDMQPALIVGGVLTVGSIMNFIQIPYHPVWFMVSNVLICLPFAWLVYFTVKKKNDAQKTADDIGDN